MTTKDAVVPYEVTVDELRALVRYWAQRQLDLNLDYFLDGITSSGDVRDRAEAASRLNTIASAIGEAAVAEVEAAVEQEVAKRLGPDLWQVFTRGVAQEYEEVQVDRHRSLECMREKLQDRDLQEQALAFLRQNPSQFFIDQAGDLWHLTTGDVENQLVLQLRTRRGASIVVDEHVVERPANWHSPYGL